MSEVWDRASQVIAGRAGILASIALLFIWLPGVIRAGIQAAVAVPGVAVPPPGGGGAVVALLGLVAAAIGAIGHLALVAVASDPGADRGDALRIAVARFWPYVGVMLVVVVVAAVLATPIVSVFLANYPSMAAMRAGTPPQLSPGAGAFVGLYGLVLTIVLVWAEARVLSVLVPVIVNERLGLGSFRRAFALTRGLTWRIVGVILLFAVVAIVVVVAVRSVVGVMLRLALGAGHATLALFLTAAVVALIGAAISVVVAAFSARLYFAAREAQPAA